MKYENLMFKCILCSNWTLEGNIGNEADTAGVYRFYHPRMKNGVYVAWRNLILKVKRPIGFLWWLIRVISSFRYFGRSEKTKGKRRNFASFRIRLFASK